MLKDLNIFLIILPLYNYFPTHFRLFGYSVVPSILKYTHIKKHGTFSYSLLEVFGVTRSDRILKSPRLMREHFAIFLSELF